MPATPESPEWRHGKEVVTVSVFDWIEAVEGIMTLLAWLRRIVRAATTLRMR
ncbi:MAG: hypothetical protein QOJ91_2725 [Sphingomonadales bacterium]|jgi:hypothetical protein|nr:hypothetical protein [Sphingomonadales bacterium]